MRSTISGYSSSQPITFQTHITIPEHKVPRSYLNEYFRLRMAKFHQRGLPVATYGNKSDLLSLECSKLYPQLEDSAVRS
ncbi:hypothetical protein CEXT_397371 [Caerostris extrusa]|uniref:Uncharacterized protein n=1 Tax=Caerostris extrusa TaxID=172846 RepID=A0AAV4Q1U4_CAEEX|nr:hypothetical protein CEXT_397371 [Caerostris extrusa]